MDAIKVLKSQHRAVEELFAQIEKTSDRAVKRRQLLVQQIADELAAHAEIEEKIFYPAANVRQTSEMLLKALEEHLTVKRLIADLLRAEPDHPTYMAKVLVLKELVEHHVKEEERELFKLAKQSLAKEALDELGARIEAAAEELKAAQPRNKVPSEIDAAPELLDREVVAEQLGIELEIKRSRSRSRRARA